MTTTENHLEELRQELAALNALLVGLGAELVATRVETAVRVEGLRAESNRERRIRVIALSGGGFFIFAAGAENSEYCSPGARIQQAIDAQERGVKSQLALKKIYDHPDHSILCDAAFPLRSHSIGQYPTPANLAGFVILGLMAVAVAIFHKIQTKRDYARVETAVKNEHSSAGKHRAQSLGDHSPESRAPDTSKS